MGKAYTPDITIRIRLADNWLVAECPDCGAVISDRTAAKVQKQIETHGKNYNHNWSGINFRIL